MTPTDLKIYALNSVALVFNFMQIDLVLKIILTGVAIAYTISKWYIMVKKYNNEKD